MDPPAKFGYIVSFSYLFNNIVQIGVNRIPYAFFKAGYAFSMIMLIIMSCITFVSSIWLCEVMARAEGLVDLVNDERETESLLSAEIAKESYSQHKVPKQADSDSDSMLSRRGSESIISPEVLANRELFVAVPAAQGMSPRKRRQLQELVVGERKLENSELVGIFLGKIPKAIFLVLYCFYSFGILWCLATLFTTTFATVVPLNSIFGKDNKTCDYTDQTPDPESCTRAYRLSVLVFLVIALPLSLLDLTQQRFFQVLMSTYRVVAMVLMLASTAAFLAIAPYGGSGSARTSAPFVANDILPFKSDGFGEMLPVMVFSQITHHFIPGVIQPTKDKRNLYRLFLVTLSTSFFFYSAIGIFIPLWFGVGTNEFITLNWLNLGSEEYFGSIYLQIFVCYPIILWPAFVGITAFPMEALTLGNNLVTILPSSWVTEPRRTWVTRLCRLVAAAAPVIPAIFLLPLDTAIFFLSTIGILLSFVFPALLQYYSKIRLDKEVFDRQVLLVQPIQTPYSGFYSQIRWVLAMIASSLVLFVCIVAIGLSELVNTV